jgi:diguanylate cyclase (GGDEF)-like protein
MNAFNQYRILETLHQSEKTAVYRAVKPDDATPYILKTANNRHISSKLIAQYQQEFEITNRLNIDGVIRSHHFYKSTDTLFLVLEDVGGITLSQWLRLNTLSILQQFDIAIALTVALGALHQAGVIHRDLNGSNIILAPETLDLKIIDFDLAIWSSDRVSVSISNNNEQGTRPSNRTLLEGTLSHIAPEQTGRLGYSIDYRTDFYALGVTLYQMFTKTLPFQAEKPLELVHEHLAKQPHAPNQIRPDLPQALSDIILKLMAKSPDDRYQSAYGILRDLQQCREQLVSPTGIADFNVASSDINLNLNWDSLFGRDRELFEIHQLWQRVSTGDSAFLWISGESGLGKTVLLQKAREQFVTPPGFQAQIKFEQQSQSVHYGGMAQILQQLVQQLLILPEALLQSWQQKIGTTLSDNVHVLAAFIPDLEILLGKNQLHTQSTSLSLSAIEARHRFDWVFVQFLRLFAQPETPLLLILDDLQWADKDALRLLQKLLNELEGCFLLVGIQRPEVSSKLTEMQAAVSGRSSHLALHPFSPDVTQQLLMVQLNQDQSRFPDFVEIVQHKTQGNPLFIRTFCQFLQIHRLLWFEPSRQDWQWDLIAIQQQSSTDNVVETLLHTLNQLPVQTQYLLKVAAHLGFEFEQAILIQVAESNVQQAEAELNILAQTGLINRTDRSTYRFAHDRVHQAAYELVDESARATLHWQIGQSLHQSAPKSPQELGKWVHYLNQGRSCLSSVAEAVQLAELNLTAGRYAKDNSAFDRAYLFFETGLSLLVENQVPENHWSTHYHLSQQLFCDATEAAYLTGNFAEMLLWAKQVLQNGQCLNDRLPVYETLVSGNLARNELVAAVDIGLEALIQLNVALPSQPVPEDIGASLGTTQAAIGNRSISTLTQLPQMINSQAISAMRLLSWMGSAAYYSRPLLYPLLACQQVQLSLEFGNTDFSSYAYATYGIILCGVLDQVEAGYEFGQLALQLVDRLQAHHLRARVALLVYAFINHWQMPIRQSLAPLLEAHQIAVENGDIESAANTLVNYLFLSYFAGRSLAELAQEMDTYQAAIERLQQQSVVQYHRLFRQVVANWRASERPTSLSGSYFNAAAAIATAQDASDSSTLFTVHFNQAILQLVFGQYSQALQNITIAESHAISVAGSINMPLLYFYGSLARLRCGELLNHEQEAFLERVAENQVKLERWANASPDNYRHKYYLIEAERCRIEQRYVEAIEYYEQAIALAKQSDYTNELALALEWTAKFYFDWSKPTLGQTYLLEAVYYYQRWGALNKVMALGQEYPDLLLPGADIVGSSNVHQSYLTMRTQALDLDTIVQACQALSQEIILDSVLQVLMRLALENAGAERGSLLLMKNGTLEITLSRCVNEVDAQHQATPWSLVQYVTRTQRSILLENAALSGLFANDAYIRSHQVKSVMCLPIVRKNRCLGLLYLENNLIDHAFTEQHVELLSLLCAQAGISLENAQLYDEVMQYSHTLEERVADRTAELERKNAQLQQEVRDREAAERALQKANEKLQRLATEDGLTRVANRRCLDEYFMREWQRSRREGQPIAFILCDIDYFKRYNDYYGHQAGDRCLMQVAQGLKLSAQRPSDLVARYGGEEFAVVLSNTQLEGAQAVAQAMRDRINQLQLPHAASEVADHVTLSIGVAYLPQVADQSPSTLIKFADEALYQAKQQGRNQIMVKICES